MSVAELTTRRKEVQTKIDGLLAKDRLTTDERSQVVEWESDFESLSNEISRLEREDRPAGRKTQPDSLSAGRFESTAGRANGGRLYREMFPAERLSNDGWGSVNEFLSAVHCGMHHPRLKLESLALGMHTGAGVSGGFLVPEEYVAEMLDKSLENEIVRPRARVEPMKYDTKSISGFDGRNNTGGNLFGGFTAQWAAQGDSLTEKTPDLRRIKLEAKKLGIYTKATNEMLADGQDFEALLSQAIIQAIGWHLDYACLSAYPGSLLVFSMAYAAVR